jgi:hypothetical protein
VSDFLNSGGAELLTAFVALLTALANVYTHVTTGRQVDDLIRTVDRQSHDNTAMFRALSGHLKRAEGQLDKLIEKLMAQAPGGS